MRSFEFRPGLVAFGDVPHHALHRVPAGVFEVAEGDLDEADLAIESDDLALDDRWWCHPARYRLHGLAHVVLRLRMKQGVDRLADQLLLVVGTKQGLRRLVHKNNLFPLVDVDGLGTGFDQAAKALFAIAQRRLRKFSRRDVPQHDGV